MKGSGVVAAMVAIAAVLVAANRLDQKFASWFANQVGVRNVWPTYNGLMPSHTPGAGSGALPGATGPKYTGPDYGMLPAH